LTANRCDENAELFPFTEFFFPKKGIYNIKEYKGKSQFVTLPQEKKGREEAR
jgi:hypothetical protein